MIKADPGIGAVPVGKYGSRHGFWYAIHAGLFFANPEVQGYYCFRTHIVYIYNAYIYTLIYLPVSQWGTAREEESDLYV